MVGAGGHRSGVWLIAALAALALAAFLAPSAGAATASWSFEPAGVDIGTFLPGEEAPEPTRLHLLNTGEVTLTPEFVILIPNPDSSFQLLYNGCDTPIFAGGRCTIEVSFKPRSPGPKEATLEVSAGGGLVAPAIAHLTGAGTAPTVSIDPATVDFGTVPAWGERPTRTVTVTNQGPTELSISMVEFHRLSGPGSDLAPLRWTGGTCGARMSVPVGGSCTAGFEFAPSTPGVYTAELEIRDAAFDSPQRIPISATATPEVTPPPAPPRPEPARAVLAHHPAKRTGSRNATFTFTGNATATGFECRLDHQPFRACTSPTRYRSLKPGGHTFQVRAGGQAIGPIFAWKVVKKPVRKKRPHRKHAR
jgi:hypothetical protein